MAFHDKHECLHFWGSSQGTILGNICTDIHIYVLISTLDLVQIVKILFYAKVGE